MKKKPAPPKLDTETASKVLAADLANLLKRVQAGQPLTHRQRQLIEEAGAPSKPKEKTEADFKAVATPAELARVLGVSRQRVAAWQGRPGAPDVGDFQGWRNYLATFARVTLKTDAAPRDPEMHNPTRMDYRDGCFFVLDRIAPQVPAEVFRSIVADVNAALRRLGFNDAYDLSDAQS